MKSKTHQNIPIGIVILVVCGFFFWLSVGLDPGSAMMPQILLGLMAFLGVMIILDGIKKTHAATPEKPVEPLITFKSLKVPGIAFLLIAVYVILFQLTGYYIATGIFMIIMMTWLKQKSWIVKILLTAVYLFLTYFVMVKQLNVSVDSLGMLGTWLAMSSI